MATDTLPLARTFAPAQRDAWLALVEKTLKGAGVETLRVTTSDGLTIEPLYVDAEPARLIPAGRDGDRAWDVRAVIAHPDPARCNEQSLEALAGGAGSILLRIDPTGARGAAIGGPSDLARALEEVMTDVAPVALNAGLLGPQAADWLGAVAKASPAAPLAIHLDPLSAFAVAGVSPGPIEAHLIAAANAGARHAETYPKASLWLASGAVAHEAGATPAWELAIAAAAALAYARAQVRAGLTQAEAFARIVLGVTVDADALASVVKMRAARVLWGKITGACDVEVAARIEARSSNRMLTRADPWTNLVRLTSAGFAAAVGGADSLALAHFTDAIGLPSTLARRLARNTQLILMEEAHVGAAADPAAGAWAVEAQTDDLARAAWAHFTAIEAEGGIVEALRQGVVAQAAANGRQALANAVAARDIRILGVTDFPNANPTAPEIEAAQTISVVAPDPRLPGPDSRCPPLTSVRLEELAA